MSLFTDAELAYLGAEKGKRPLARLATVGPDGTPHVAPVGMWSLADDDRVMEVTGWGFEKSKKFRDVARTGRAAIVIDDFDPDATSWQPRGIEIRGRAEAVTEPQPAIRIHPERIIGWGLDDPQNRNARSVG